MKRLFLSLILFMSVAATLRAADGDLFPYPQPPADMERLDERCDFIISRFWRQCDFKSAMSKTDKLRSTFSDWINLMPYATADTVHVAIDRLLASVAKSAQQTLALAQMAEEFAYSDSSEMRSAEIFLPFAKAVVSNKKIKQPDRDYFADRIKRIENVQIGVPVKHFAITAPDGTRQTLDNFSTQMVIVVFNKHDNPDSSMGRVRLSADYNINNLIERGLLTLISVEPGAPSPEWLTATTTYPANWVVGAMPDAYEWFEIERDPSIMLLDGRHKVLAKNLNVDAIMVMMDRLRQQSGL